MRVGVPDEGSCALIKRTRDQHSPIMQAACEAGHAPAWRNPTLLGTLRLPASSFAKNKGLLLGALVFRDKSVQ